MEAAARLPAPYPRTMPDLVHIDERKWPDRRHWQLDARRLGEDEHGTWLHVPGSTMARRGDEPTRRLDHGFVVCVPVAAWWLIEFYEHHPRLELYVNIGTPPVWDGSRIRQIDLDLDVVRRLDGTVAILDEDEFLDHQVRFGYPSDLIEHTRAAADRAVDMLRRRDEPFGSAAGRWLELAGRR